MFNLGDITKENKKEHNKKWPCIPDHPYRILIIGGSGSGKTNAILNLINQQDDIDKNYLYAKDLSEPIYQFLIKKRENIGKKYLNDPKAFIEGSNTINDYLWRYWWLQPNKKKKKFIVFDDMIVDVISNKKKIKLSWKNCLLGAEN